MSTSTAPFGRPRAPLAKEEEAEKKEKAAAAEAMVEKGAELARVAKDEAAKAEVASSCTSWTSIDPESRANWASAAVQAS